MPILPKSHRLQIAQRRIKNILRTHKIANFRTIEQKIAEAGPYNQRVDPHILTTAKTHLIRTGEILQTRHSGTPWYFLPETPEANVQNRFQEQLVVYNALHSGNLNHRIGQSLEIAIFRALRTQTSIPFLGSFPDLDQHDDNAMYAKEEPPSSISGNTIPRKQKLDFILLHPTAGTAGIEAKNIREWLYPDRYELKELLYKCCFLNAVPVLIARRIQYATFSVLNPCGLLLHQTYKQLMPLAERDLALQAKQKLLLGYHDISIGNDPDPRLLKFITVDLPLILPAAREKFDAFKDLLCSYAYGELKFPEFLFKVRKRQQGLPEDYEDEIDTPDFSEDW